MRTRVVSLLPFFIITIRYSIDCFPLTATNIPVKKLCLVKSLATSNSDYSVAFCSGDEESISRAAKFMVDSFWLPQGISATSPIQYGGFTWAVAEDLMQRYGETMGARTFDSRLVIATPRDDSTIVGMVALDVTLISAEQMLMRNRGESESILKDAINALGPKQRRQYKGSSIQNIVESLLPPQKAVVVLSNLAVNPSFRRNGVALRLCNEVERIAKEDWGFDELYLRVESSNVAARALYETQLSYRLAWVEKNAVALRADLKSGNFVECASDTLILVKSL